MSQFQKLVGAIPVRQRWMIGIVSLCIALAVFGFSKWQSDRNFKPLYTGLAAEDAGAVVQKLRGSNVEYRLAENGTSVLVPTEKIAELRLEFASAGIPKSGRIGFELFDKTNFGMTEFTEHVNYRRALEGELERSVISLSEVEQARVHLTFPKESVFTESRQPAKASVLLKLRTGARLQNSSVMGITNLVASAVEGLSAESVSVMDMHGNLLIRARTRAAGDDSANSEVAIEYRQKLEKDIVAKVNATLEPLLGSEKFRAAVSVEVDTTSAEESAEIFDPEKSVVSSSQTTENKQAAGMPIAGGQPGTASNLPRPPVGGSNNADGNTQVAKTLTYQTTRTMRHTKLPQGGITKLSVAVLLDQGVRFEGSGPTASKVLIPIPAERIEKIQKLISAAVGLSTERGDQLIVESLPFDSTLNLEIPAASPLPSTKTQPAPFDLLKDPKLRWIGAGGVTVAVLLALIAVARRRKRKPSIAIESVPIGNELSAPQEHAALESPAAAEPHINVPSFEASQLSGISSSRVEVLAGKLRETVKDDAEIYASVLRGWLVVEEVRK